ncbi:Gfo/Idh/MocA family oxidoreductase [Burkholderia plantarii]|uniref:Gfo/Idh/MocA family oxidoreductase n=1 Tax=Burkholderia plantarii TaxID=41899 RepID=UPI0018DC0916|nr:Gfo/Idh/MocA family oxidoreductase [Burkholderia plantarii]MBI0329423.1 Gfo/Idh/MocA family oxidoreductase [Burkholderia plantarii]
MKPNAKFGAARNRRVLVVGSKFGEIYLNAFLEAQPGFELAGLLANGSPRARQLAQAYGIALYTSLDDLPPDIDIACVVVRSAVVGGMGTVLAQAMLERGAHVVQEHPLHPDDIVRLQRVAGEMGRAYWVNGFYPHTAAGRCWIEQARRVAAALDHAPARFAHLTTSRQLLYSSLDLLLQACGATDASVEPIPDDDPDFQLLRIGLPGCRALLRLQTWLDPDDPDLHSLAMHQLTLGWPSGYLSLEASYGPVVWTSSPYDPRHRDNQRSLYRAANAERPYLDWPPAATLHAAPACWGDTFEIDGPAGVARVLHLLGRHLDGAAAPEAFDAAYQLALARLWQHVLQCAGPARERHVTAPPELDPRALASSSSDTVNAP